MQFIDLKAQHRRLATEIGDGIADVLESQAFIQGPQVKALERALQDFCGAGHAITCANGTDALQIALMALEVGQGDAVFVPSFTYTATAEVILLLGATPVFVDVDPATYNLDFTDLEAAIERVKTSGRLRPAALFTVDLFGMPVDYDRARTICRTQGLSFVSDAAQGFGASFNGRRVGSGMADITTTSFFPAKPLGCYGDGGAIFTDDGDLAERMRSICLHGKGAAKYDVVRLGVNSRLDTLQAAVLLPKLAIFADELEARDRAARRYCSALGKAVQLPILPDGDDRFAWAQFTIQLDGRDQVQAALKDMKVPSNVYYPRPMHLQEAYARFGEGEGSLPVSEMLSQRVLSLPMHPYLSDDEIDHVANSVLAAVAA